LVIFSYYYRQIRIGTSLALLGESKREEYFMKKKICLSFAVICSMSLLATSALADEILNGQPNPAVGSGPSCGYDYQRTQELLKKGKKRADRAKEIVQDMIAGAEAGAKDQFDAKNDKDESGFHKFKKSAKNYDAMMPEALPAMLKDPARCLVVIPSEKSVDYLVPFFAGVDYGRGVEYCGKKADGTPDLDHPSSYVQLEGASIGPKFGLGEATDLVLSVSQDDVKNRKVNAAAKLSVTPIVGRSAEVGVQSDGKSIKPAVAVSYSHTKGFLFAADFDFKTIAQDKDMVDAEAGRIAPERNPLMRWLHSDSRKKADAACIQKDQAIASAQAAPASLEDATVALVLPSEAAPQVVAPVAVANAAINDGKSLNPEAQASAVTPAVVAAQAGETLGDAPLVPIDSLIY
jgi:lipid-binding SYLF domain-containing protein